MKTRLLLATLPVLMCVPPALAPTFAPVCSTAQAQDLPKGTQKADQNLPTGFGPGFGPASTDHAVAAPLSLLDRSLLTRVETYLNSIHTLHGRFLQVATNADTGQAETSQGEAWLERPGRMRFQYDPPSPLLLVAGHGQVIFHDKDLDQTSHIPLDSTPLGLLLRDNIHLNGDVTVTDLRRLPGQVQLTLTRTARPHDGSLTLVLTDAPITLRSWTVLDAQHRETRVSLFDVKMGGNFDQSLFTFTEQAPQGEDDKN